MVVLEAEVEVVGNMRFTVTVYPGSKKAGVRQVDENNFDVRVKARAQKGQANHEVIEQMAKFLELKESQIYIVRGHKGRKKLVEVLNNF